MVASSNVPLPESELLALAARPEVQQVVANHHAQGIQTYEDHSLARGAFGQRLLRVTRRWFGGADRELPEALSKLAGADLYLTSACEARRDSAWVKLRHAFRGRLLALGVSRSMPRESALEWIDDMLADLSLPPTRGADQHRIGAYSGRGSLFSFLATLFLRKRADEIDAATRRRARGERKLEREGAGKQAAASSLERALGAELATQVREGLRGGLDACTAREHLALVLKYRDGRAQKDIARLLDVGPPRVSRLVEAGLAKVARGLEAHLEEMGRAADHGDAWEMVCDAVRQALLARDHV